MKKFIDDLSFEILKGIFSKKELALKKIESGESSENICSELFLSQQHLDYWQNEKEINKNLSIFVVNEILSLVNEFTMEEWLSDTILNGFKECVLRIMIYRKWHICHIFVKQGRDFIRKTIRLDGQVFVSKVSEKTFLEKHANVKKIISNNFSETRFNTKYSNVPTIGVGEDVAFCIGDQLIIALDDLEDSERYRSITKEEFIEFDVLAVSLSYKMNSKIDALTHLRNRSSFDEVYHFDYFIMVDIDNFKKINDTYGHEKGDQVLKSVAEALSSVARKQELFRIGGEEFCVLLKNVISDEVAFSIAERLRKAVEKRKMQNILVTISIGLSKFCKNKDISKDMADRALYEAKRSGKNKTIFWKSSLGFINCFV